MKNQKYEWICKNGQVKTSFEDICFIEPPVYEVIRLIGGQPLFFEEHYERLKHSLEILSYDYLIDKETLLSEISLLVKQQGINNENIRIEIGRNSSESFVRVLFIINSYYPDLELYREGVMTSTSKIVREAPHAKVLRQSYMEAVNQAKQEKSAYEILLLNQSGQLSEGSRSNLFFISDNQLISAKSESILLGVTRFKVIECAKALNIDYVEREINQEDIASFDAAFLSGTSINILPIAQIDSYHFEFKDNVLLKKLMTAFDAVIKADLNQY